MAIQDNPWYQQHKYEYAAGDREEQKIVEIEYAGSEEFTRPCHWCGDGMMYFKATIGVLKCATCGALAHCNGDPI